MSKRKMEVKYNIVFKQEDYTRDTEDADEEYMLLVASVTFLHYPIAGEMYV